MDSQYYFVAAALPPLVLGLKPEITFQELRDLFFVNLKPRDLKQLEYLLRLHDLNNIRALWMNLPMDPRGNFSPKELEEALLVPDLLPSYVQDFLERYESTRDRLHYFSSLYVSLFQDMEKRGKGFLKRYYQFERELRLVITALRAKQSRRDLAQELQFEDVTDPFAAEIWAQKEAAEYTPPAEYAEVQRMFQEASEPRQLHLQLLAYKLHKIEEMEQAEPFSMDHLLGYAARLLILESWETLNREQGLSIVEDLSKYG
jgi:hypothetical protein